MFYILKRSKYYPIFASYGTNFENINIFEIENKLDKFYFENIMKVAKLYSNTLEDMIGKKIDLSNILWIYRIKKNYNFSEKELKDILINFNYKLKKSEIKELIQVKSISEMDGILEKTYYAKYIDFKNYDDLEAEIDKFLYKLYKKYFKESILSNSQIYAYISIIEMENNDIMNIIEGIRYGLNQEQIRKKLVC